MNQEWRKPITGVFMSKPKFRIPEVLQTLLGGKSPEEAEEYLAPTESPVPTTFVYILVMLNESPPEKVSELTSDVVAFLRSKKCSITSLGLPLIIGTFGGPLDPLPDSNAQIDSAVQEVVGLFPHEVKLVYGALYGLYGMFGLREAPCFGPLIPGFERRLEALLKLEFGQFQRLD